MKITDLLREAKTAAPSVAASLHEFKNNLPKIKTAISAFDQGRRLFRGLTHTDKHEILFKPQMTQGARKSANTENYYTLFVDNHPSWAAFPPRSASMVCSTSSGTASGYSNGSPYVVLPLGDPVVGVSPSSDYWISFERVNKLYNYADLADMNRALKIIMNLLAGESNWQPKTYQELCQGLEKIDAVNTFSFPDLPPLPEKFADESGMTTYVMIGSRIMKINPGTTMVEKLAWLLDPHANGFSAHKLSELPVTSSSQEVWTQAPAWLLKTSLLPEDWQQDEQFNLASWIDRL